MNRFDYDEIYGYFYIIDRKLGYTCPLARCYRRDDAIKIVDALNTKENAE